MRPKGTRGFTLTELMVVVTIIALLAALLMPALNRALAQAKRQKSLQNLRSTGHCLELYVTDNDNHYPMACDSAWAANFWCYALAPYMTDNVTLNKYGTSTTFRISASLVDPLVASNRHHVLGDYGANSDIFAGPIGTPVTTAPVSRASIGGRLSQIVTLISAEGNTMTPPTGGWYFSRLAVVNKAPGNWGTSYPSDHGTGFYLCLFGDSHVEAIGKDDFIKRRADLLSVSP